MGSQSSKSSCGSFQYSSNSSITISHRFSYLAVKFTFDGDWSSTQSRWPLAEDDKATSCATALALYSDRFFTYSNVSTYQPYTRKGDRRWPYGIRYGCTAVPYTAPPHGLAGTACSPTHIHTITPINQIYAVGEHALHDDTSPLFHQLPPAPLHTLSQCKVEHILHTASRLC